MRSFSDLHPSVLLVWLMSVILTAAFVTDPVIQVSALLGGLLLSASLGRINASKISFFVLMLLLVAVTNPIFSHEGATPLLFVNGTPVTLEALVYGILLGCMLVGIMVWCVSLDCLLPGDRVMYLFGRIMPKTALVMSSVLRSIPMMLRRYRSVSAARKASGAVDGDRYISKVKSVSGVFMSLMSWSLENSIDTAASMKARGYGASTRTSYSTFKFTRYDAVMLTSCLALLSVSLFGIARGYVYFQCYPNVTPINTSFAAICTYAAFALLSFIPFLSEMKGRLIWKYCLSRI